ncbi:hypothetical protein PR048_002575 [Dryococelus australis]|uniref:HTH psq-type domain-containing protein n=1 Tax=Dryococelus australis TaxID=614101 RepID=A0ABQ9IKL7_9NEOP|nr:hypothetical protein PR048_002575 [Dryococelus australis]
METPSPRDMSQFSGHQMVPLPSCGVSSSPTSPCLTSCPSMCPSSCNGPATTTQVRRKRSINPQADENFIRALEAVRFGGIGFCKAARMYGVNNRTLWLEYKKRGYPVTRPSLKSRVKQEPTPVQMEQASSMIPPQVMGPPPQTSTGMGEGFADSRPPPLFVHPQSPMPPRQRFQESVQINVNPSSMNIHGVHFSAM